MRWRRDPGSGKLSIERIHLVTSLPPGAASGGELAAWIRGHWKIENQLHHVRDRTFGEDASKLRTRHLPRIMAGLRNLAIDVPLGRRAGVSRSSRPALLGAAARAAAAPLPLRAARTRP